MEKIFLYFYQKKVLDNLNHLLKTNTKDILNFLALKILNSTHELLNAKLCDSLPDFLFSL